MKKVSFLTTKPLQYYKGIRIKADIGLHDQLADIIRATLPEDSKILDYGAGEGALSQRLFDLGYRVYSVDIDRESFKAQTPFERLDFNNPADIVSFKKKHANEFDLVLGIEVIEHVENPWQYIRDLKSLVKPGGWISISTPNITSWYSRVNFFFKGRFHQFECGDRHYGHINPITEDELRLICEQSGLLVEKMMPGGWLPRLWLSRSPKVLLANLFGFLGSFFMRGTYDGWCIIALIRKP
ncbi:MAG: class I SAM-dependent methyltransferase [Actinobacteria bacterium]|nr:class I SAM-dependent methyltransferase [Actinomycetota bacterium]